MLTDRIESYLRGRDMENLKSLLLSSEDMELLEAFYDLTSDEQVIVFRLLSKDKALFIFEQLDTNHQHNLLQSFTDEKAIVYINELAPDDRVKLLDELPASVAKKLISMLSHEERKATNLLLGYQPETAGRIMTTEFITLKRGMNAAQSVELVLKLAKQKETIYTIFVTDRQKVLEGVLSLKELLIADDDAMIEDIMHTKVIRISTDTSDQEAARILQELDLLALPVVDREDRLVGMVTIDDAIDIIEEDATEYIYDQAGLADVKGSEEDRSHMLVNGTFLEIWKVRLPFLIITLIAGIIAAFVIDRFEATLKAIVAVAAFIPLIMDMGGTVGTQSSTIFARGVALGDIDIKNFKEHFIKEILVGISIGTMIGVVSGIVAGLMQGIPMLGVAVGIALICTMTLASLLGFLVPYILIRLNVDQAAGSAPIITSIKDISGLLIYFVMVTALMRYLV